ncbi:inactive serine/threonine-protein kinase 19 isoform X2 [Pseudophryne corroboree]|uniref:inactive serine/threonine-protein kinase 19 isoform X2 n=1 Tax=Pseudophryne corroboree TaxID=495146 RepID=UPI0030819C24
MGVIEIKLSPSLPPLPFPSMDRKRKLICDTFKVKKQRKEAETVKPDFSAIPSPYPDFTEEPQEAVLYLCTLFPRKLYNDSLPPIFLRHQMYSLIQDRTTADRLLSTLQQKGEVCLVQPGFDADTFLVVMSEDLRRTVIKSVDGSSGAPVVHKFLDSSLIASSKISYNREEMMEKHRFSDGEITQLVHAGLLTVRDAGSWWLSIPGAGRFISHFIKGRKAILAQISRSRYKEVLLTDLSTRKPPHSVRLGMEYHIHDIIGAGLVDCIPTPSGSLLRLSDT